MQMISTGKRARRFVALLLTLLFTTICMTASLSGQTASAQIGTITNFDYPRASNWLVLELEVFDGKIAEQDRAHRIQLFGDGTVNIHHPAYDLRAGDTVARIAPERLTQLLASTLEQGLHDFDAPAVTEATRVAESNRNSLGNLAYTSDDTFHRLRLRLGSYTAASTGVIIQGFDKTISWHNLNWHNQRYPEVAALGDLATTVREIEDLVSNELQQAEEGN